MSWYQYHPVLFVDLPNLSIAPRPIVLIFSLVGFSWPLVIRFFVDWQCAEVVQVVDSLKELQLMTAIDSELIGIDGEKAVELLLEGQGLASIAHHGVYFFIWHG